MRKLQVFIFSLFLILAFPSKVKASEDSIKVTKELQELNSKRLSKYYDAYNVTIENLSNKDIKINNIGVNGNVLGDSAYQRAKSANPSSLGTTWAVGLTFWWVLLLPLVYAIVATPVLLISNSTKDGSSSKESKKYTNSYKDIKSIPAKSKLNFGLLVPKGKSCEVFVNS
jgi:hypothetical protein